MARIAIFGAGYVGLVTGACFADLGHEVVVRDVLPERIERLRAGEVPIYEPGLDEVLERNRERISFTLDVREAVDGAEFLYVAVGTPPTASGDADLSAVWTVVDELPEDVQGRPLIVMKSTVPVGTGAHVRARLDARGLDNVGYVSNPEFTAEGTAVRDFMEPDRVVIGAFEQADGDAVEALHAGIDAPVVRADVTSAELIKLAANAFLVTRISFINEIANVCELVGADVTRVAEGIGLDHRLGPHFLRAGLGWGGSCFPKDSLALKQLAANSGYHFQLLNAVIEVNELQNRRVVQKLQQRLGNLRGRTIALLGLAFKPNTDDMREAPSRIIAHAPARGRRRGAGWDPVARPGDLEEVEICDSVLDAVRGRGRRRDRDRVAAAARAHDGRGSGRDGAAADRRRPEPPRSRGRRRGGLRVRGNRPADPRDAGSGAAELMEALLLAGGKAERLGEAAQGLPKPLVPVAGFPLAEYTVARLVDAGVTRVDRGVPRRGRGRVPSTRSPGSAPRSKRWGRRSRSAAAAVSGLRRRDGRRRGRCSRSTATSCSTSTSAPSSPSTSGAAPRRRSSSRRCARRSASSTSKRTARSPAFARRRCSSSGSTPASTSSARTRSSCSPRRATTSSRPSRGSPSERRLHAHRHDGVWLTVNTPKDLRRATEFMEAHPEWKPQRQLA